MATRKDIADIIAYMKLAYSNYSPDVTSPLNALDVFEDLLGDFDAEMLHTAIKVCCSQAGQFAPSAGDIRETVIQISMQADRVPTAGQAWGAIIGSYERMPNGNMAGGGHKNPENIQTILDNPLVIEAIYQLGGYTEDLYENQMSSRSKFFEIYKTLYELEITKRLQPPSVKAYITTLQNDKMKMLVNKVINKLEEK